MSSAKVKTTRAMTAPCVPVRGSGDPASASASVASSVLIPQSDLLGSVFTRLAYQSV